MVNTAEKFLQKEIDHIDVAAIPTVSGILSAFKWTSYQSRTLARCYEVYREMLEDPKRPVIFLGLAGAMVPAGMKKLISLLVKKKMVDVIVSTGANMYHDTVEALGSHHYVGWPEVDDRELYKHGIDRIYDTFANEKEYRAIDRKIQGLADKLAIDEPNGMSSRRFMSYLGEFIHRNGDNEEKKDSVVWNSWRAHIPIFVPALCDSSLGLAVTQHYVQSLQEGKKPLLIDQIRDNYEIFCIKKAAKKTGVIYVGGGVPKNYIQQTAYLEDLFGIPNSGHDYGIQITTDRPEWGGLSGCTFREGMSWGKERPKGKYVACYCDATIAFPLVVRAVLETCKSIDKRKGLNLFPK